MEEDCQFVMMMRRNEHKHIQMNKIIEKLSVD